MLKQSLIHPFQLKNVEALYIDREIEIWRRPTLPPRHVNHAWIKRAYFRNIRVVVS